MNVIEFVGGRRLFFWKFFVKLFLGRMHALAVGVIIAFWAALIFVVTLIEHVASYATFWHRWPPNFRADKCWLGF